MLQPSHTNTNSVRNSHSEKKFAKLTNCSLEDMQCLRALPAIQAIRLGEKASSDVVENIIDRILEGGHVEDAFAMQWAPVVDVDGKELPGLPLELFAKGKFNKVPVLIGTNQDE